METSFLDYFGFRRQLKDKSTSKVRILVVDDDATFRPIWSSIIEKADRNAYFEWAESASEAEEKIENAILGGVGFSLVVTDIYLSGNETGVDLWRKYKKVLGGKIILVSSIDYFRVIKKMIGVEVAPYYIKKPLNIEECISAVHGVLHAKTGA